MSIITPFRGIRYYLDAAGELNDLIAPPYDVISTKMQRELLDRSPYNVIHLILGQDREGDTVKTNKYTRAAELWRSWREQGLLVRDAEPGIYRYQVSFSRKTPRGIEVKKRPGFVALLKLHEYSRGKVLPHERTLAGPKEDRFQLLLHTRAHLSQVFLLYPDPGGKSDRLLGSEPPAGEESWSCEDDLGVNHLMWRVRDRETILAITDHLEQHPLYIADGHHRYETALAFRKHLLQTSPLFAHGSDRVMAYFTPADDPGLVVFPYHRLVHNLPRRRLSGLLKKLETHFQLERALLSPLEPGAHRREFMTSLEERGQAGPVMGMVEAVSGRAFYLSLKPDSTVKRSCSTPAELLLADLDVVILEDLLLIGMLGMKPRDLLAGKYVSYETDYDRVLDALGQAPFQLAFLLNPTPVTQVIRVADHRGVMPEKSTYFFPKIATGLVMNSLEE